MISVEVRSSGPGQRARASWDCTPNAWKVPHLAYALRCVASWYRNDGVAILIRVAP